MAIINEMTPKYSPSPDNPFNLVPDRDEPERNDRGHIIIDKSRFDKDELASENFRIVHEYYQAYGKFNSNSTYARRMSRVIGDLGDQFRVQIQSLFDVGRYKLEKIKGPLNKLYAEYGIGRKAKDTDLEEFGYKIKRVRPHNVTFVEIQKTPQID